MDRKYVLINGLAFCEESEMNKLKEYAKQGWILETIVAGFFYKFKKDEPKNIEYSVDYQFEADEEYFNIFSTVGWTKVVSVGNQIHIFSAAEGTKPIYSDKESETDKYISMKKQTGKRTIYSLIAMIVLVLMQGYTASLKVIYIIVFSLFIGSMVTFIFNFMPYLAYTYRLRRLRKVNKQY